MRQRVVHKDYHEAVITKLMTELAQTKTRLSEAEGWLRQFNTCLSLQDTIKLLHSVAQFLSRGADNV